MASARLRARPTLGLFLSGMLPRQPVSWLPSFLQFAARPAARWDQARAGGERLGHCKSRICVPRRIVAQRYEKSGSAHFRVQQMPVEATL